MASVRKSPKKRTKAGTSKASSAERKVLFVDAYLSNNGNLRQSALAAGYTEGGADKAGYRLSRDAAVMSMIGQKQRELSEKAGLSLERTLKEIGRLAYADPRKMFDERGNLKPINELDDDTAATLASFEVDEISVGTGKDKMVIGHTKKIKAWDKKGALDMAMRFHGAYASDNAQKNPEPEKLEDIPVLEIARRLLFLVAGANIQLESQQ